MKLKIWIWFKVDTYCLFHPPPPHTNIHMHTFTTTKNRGIWLARTCKTIIGVIRQAKTRGRHTDRRQMSPVRMARSQPAFKHRVLSLVSTPVLRETVLHAFVQTWYWQFMVVYLIWNLKDELINYAKYSWRVISGLKLRDSKTGELFFIS